MTSARQPASPAWLRGGMVLLGLLALAAVLRLPFLDTRGTWDADQGHDMSVLRAFVRDGVVPLLGPPTSLGDVHHGALYYYLLAPAAALTGGGSPLAVTLVIAVCGIAAVGVTWWLARDIGGPVAGFVAGLAMAVSATAIDESTFIWNPNLIALSSAIALAGAWRAWTTGRPRWWLLAAVGTAVTMQCHVLGVTLLPIVGALLVADARSRREGPERRAVWLHGLAGLAIVALSFAPLAVHELTSGFSEVAAALAYFRSGGDPGTLSPPVRALVIALRVLSWPLSGLITDAFAAGLLAAGVVVAIAIVLAHRGTPRERQAARWLGGGLAWTVGFLTFASPSLATVVPGLPNDHYHAFADPMVFVLVGLGAGALWRWRAAAGSGAGRAVAPAEAEVEVEVEVDGGSGDKPAGARASESRGAGALTGDSHGAGALTSDSPAARARARESRGAGARASESGGAGLRVGRVAAVVALCLLVGWNLAHQPPAVNADGGFPAADRAAMRIAAAAGGAPIVLRSLPAFKSADAYAYPLARAGVTVRSMDAAPETAEVRPGETLVVICDEQFAGAIGAPCGGQAEASLVPGGGGGTPILRFEAAPGRFVSVYPAAP